MTTAEIEALYIKHADDFRLLLGAHKDGPVLAVFDRDTTLGYGAGGFCNQWLVSNIHAGAFCIPAVLAVAAMESAWRERLREKNFVTLHPDGTVTCVGQLAVAYLNEDGGWSLNPNDAISYAYAADAICVAVAALAAEKRAEAGMEKMGFERVEAKPADHPKSEPPQNTKPADIAKRIAGSAASMAAKFQPDDDPIVAAMHLGNLAALVSSLATRVAEIGGEQA